MPVFLCSASNIHWLGNVLKKLLLDTAQIGFNELQSTPFTGQSPAATGVQIAPVVLYSLYTCQILANVLLTLFKVAQIDILLKSYKLFDCALVATKNPIRNKNAFILFWFCVKIYLELFTVGWNWKSMFNSA